MRSVRALHQLGGGDDGVVGEVEQLIPFAARLVQGCGRRADQIALGGEGSGARCQRRDFQIGFVRVVGRDVFKYLDVRLEVADLVFITQLRSRAAFLLRRRRRVGTVARCDWSSSGLWRPATAG